MTRDEAVKKAEDCFQFNVPGHEWFFTPLRLVAALENLGLLKLDEPKAAEDELREAVNGAELGYVDWNELTTILAVRGLKVVRDRSGRRREVDCAWSVEYRPSRASGQGVSRYHAN